MVNSTPASAPGSASGLLTPNIKAGPPAPASATSENPGIAQDFSALLSDAGAIAAKPEVAGGPARVAVEAASGGTAGKLGGKSLPVAASPVANTSGIASQADTALLSTEPEIRGAKEPETNDKPDQGAAAEAGEPAPLLLPVALPGIVPAPFSATSTARGNAAPSQPRVTIAVAPSAKAGQAASSGKPLTTAIAIQTSPEAPRAIQVAEVLRGAPNIAASIRFADPAITASAGATQPAAEDASRAPVQVATASRIAGQPGAVFPAPAQAVAQAQSIGNADQKPGQHEAPPATHALPKIGADFETRHSSTEPMMSGPMLLHHPASTGHQPIAAPREVAATSASPTGEAPQDFATLVSRIAEAREAAAPQMVRTALHHAEFGTVSLQFRHDEGRTSVTLASNDPGFTPAVQAAAASAMSAQVSTGDNGQSSAQNGQARAEHQGQPQPGTTANAGTGGSQGQSQNQPRSGEQADSRGPWTPGSGSTAQARQGSSDSSRSARRPGIYA